jgi:alpha-galactosidase
VLAKKLAGGDVAVALFNQSGGTTTISTTAAAIGMSGSSFTLRDVWSNATSTTTGTISAGVPSHGTVVYRVSRSDTPTSPPPTSVPTSEPPSSGPPTLPPTAGSCRVSDTVNAWNNGLTANITIANTGPNAISGWSLAFTLPSGQTITSGWNAAYSPSSGQVTARNVSYNGDLAPNASVTIGFQATHTGNAAAPTSFTLNGVSCAVA